MQKFKDVKSKILEVGTLTSAILFNISTKVLATGNSAINTEQVNTITDKIKNAVTSLAMPIGSLLIFICVVLTAIRLAVNHNNPKARTENLSSLGWLVIAGLILGASLIIAGIIINVTSNNGALWIN